MTRRMADSMKILQVMVVFILWRLPIDEACSPHHGFFAISNKPSKGRNSGDFFMYAIHTDGISSLDEIEFAKDELGLACDISLTGEIRTTYSDLWGCYLQLGMPDEHKESRFGTFTVSHSSGKSVNTFIRRKTKLLDTGGVYTATVYPKTIGSNELAESDDNSIGIVCNHNCQTIEWFKGNRRIMNAGPRLTVNNTEDAGIYTIRRRNRAMKHWFVQIEVIVASCPALYYMNTTTYQCTDRFLSRVCLNGGVPKNEEDACTCPPYYMDSDCGIRVASPPDLFVLADGQRPLYCGDLAGGNAMCQGYLFCAGDLFGCQCFPGWHGNNCDKPCREGKWGIACSLSCPRRNRNCNRYDGIGNESTRFFD
ncbi:Tyrosine-protein kinase receptor Tie-1 [Holothuria leucospilota]|uniref:Tyrosine-protein kinase receptor Tie-1 n=1 Tax=Holothuria leucospilota TaxID=206669 RepID=A0A9Q1HMF8_HOLLE|nr:Tyrosine-protein kinase receptor Tie-1 [Holothuria leucospilota]